MQALAQQLRLWRRGVASEIDFWDRWFASKGAEWPEDFVNRQRPDREIEPWLLRRFSDPHSIRILDVGAGPMSSLGPCYQGKPLDLTACDPLAPAYDILAKRYGVERPIITRQAFAEDLTAVFEPETFDFTHCQNALDHSLDPVRGIEEMLAVTKVGGQVVLRHALNEALNGNWDGLHQWNFDSENGHFVIWNRDDRVNVTDRFSAVADIETHVENGGIYVSMNKIRSNGLDILSRQRERVQEIMGAILLSSDGVVERLEK